MQPTGLSFVDRVQIDSLAGEKQKQHINLMRPEIRHESGIDSTNPSISASVYLLITNMNDLSTHHQHE